ncbi:uncharacterized protein EV154DRAFT_488827, partial [Mucor mucedo]|uniref:uncharacterized protein n=1 Tax=Mucor mucedo TaxID=29922 RepID=UPI00221F01DA
RTVLDDLDYNNYLLEQVQKIQIYGVKTVLLKDTLFAGINLMTTFSKTRKTLLLYENKMVYQIQVLSDIKLVLPIFRTYFIHLILWSFSPARVNWFKLRLSMFKRWSIGWPDKESASLAQLVER